MGQSVIFLLSMTSDTLNFVLITSVHGNDLDSLFLENNDKTTSRLNFVCCPSNWPSESTLDAMETVTSCVAKVVGEEEPLQAYFC